MTEVDLNQDPAVFAALAKNKAPADPNGQPTVPDPAGSKPTEEPKPTTPAPAPVDPAKVPEAKPPKEEAPADPQGQPKAPTPEEKQAQEAARKISELGEENATKFKSMVSVVRDNPDTLKSIHSTDPKLADQIAKEIWGADDFNDLMQQAEIEELKEKDPDSAAQAERIYKLEKENLKTQKRLRESDESAFYAAKGIMNNPFDPKYKALHEAMGKVNPELVKDNYGEALKLAHTLAFPSRSEAEIEADKKAILLAKATGAPSAPGIAPSNQREPESQYEPEQRSFMQKVGVNK